MSICPHCGSDAVIFSKYKVVDFRKRQFSGKSRDLGMQSVGNCQTCGYTFVVAQSIQFTKRIWKVFLHGSLGFVLGWVLLLVIALNFSSSNSDDSSSVDSFVPDEQSIVETDNDLWQAPSDGVDVSSSYTDVENGFDSDEVDDLAEFIPSDEEILVSNGLPEIYVTSVLQVFSDLGLKAESAKFSKTADWYAGERYNIRYNSLPSREFLVYFQDSSVKAVYTNDGGQRELVWGSYS